MAGSSDFSLLHEIQDSHEPGAARFDDGPPLVGRVAVLPSAFNPPTIAHLALLNVARQLEGVGSAIALLTTRNVDKGLTGASFEDRIGMLLAARSETPWLGVFATNQARIIDQAAALAACYPGLDFDFVVGHDTLIRLFDPRYYTEMARELEPFFARARVVALNRGEADVAAVQGFIEREAAPFAGRIVVCELDGHSASLSSTLAREAFSKGAESLAAPSSVAAYIREHGLYR